MNIENNHHAIEIYMIYIFEKSRKDIIDCMLRADWNHSGEMIEVRTWYVRQVQI